MLGVAETLGYIVRGVTGFVSACIGLHACMLQQQLIQRPEQLSPSCMHAFMVCRWKACLIGGPDQGNAASAGFGSAIVVVSVWTVCRVAGVETGTIALVSIPV